MTWKREESMVKNSSAVYFNNNYCIWEFKISSLSPKDGQSCNEYELTVLQIKFTEILACRLWHYFNGFIFMQE